MRLAYSEYYDKLNSILAQAKKVMETSKISNATLLESQLQTLDQGLTDDCTLRIALIGEFSAGKSSIIAALTGKDILIDADVSTTGIHDYRWRGLILTDTPGVQAEGKDTDHDRIAREATIGADIILFVITNELFSPRLAAHLQYILDDSGLGLARKTAVVINKMDRETNPDAVVIGEVAKVLGPHRDVPVYLCAASKFLRAETAPEEHRERFIMQSRLREFVEQIDGFVKDAGKLGQLSTPLQILIEIMDSLQSALLSSNEDKKRLELVRRKKVILIRLQKRLMDTRNTWKQKAYSTIMAQANGAVEQVSEVTTDKDLQRFFDSGLKQAAAEIDQLYNGVEVDISEAVSSAQAELEELGDSPLGKEVSRFDASRANQGNVVFDGQRPTDGNYLARFAKSTSSHLQKGLETAAKDAKNLRNVVIQVGKKFGKKFRPWEAVKKGEKLAKIAGRAGKAVPFLAATLDFYIQYREEKVKEEKARYLAMMRISLRNAFADQARVEAEALEGAILKVSQGHVTEALKNLDIEAELVATGRTDREEIMEEIAQIKRSATLLRDNLYGGL